MDLGAGTSEMLIKHPCKNAEELIGNLNLEFRDGIQVGLINLRVISL